MPYFILRVSDPCSGIGFGTLVIRGAKAEDALKLGRKCLKTMDREELIPKLRVLERVGDKHQIVYNDVELSLAKMRALNSK